MGCVKRPPVRWSGPYIPHTSRERCWASDTPKGCWPGEHLFNRAARSPPGRVWNSRVLCCRVTKHAGVRRPTHRSLMCCPAGWPGSLSFCRKEKYQDPLVLFLRWLAGWKVPRPFGTFFGVAGKYHDPVVLFRPLFIRYSLIFH